MFLHMNLSIAQIIRLTLSLSDGVGFLLGKHFFNSRLVESNVYRKREMAEQSHGGSSYGVWNGVRITGRLGRTR